MQDHISAFRQASFAHIFSKKVEFNNLGLRNSPTVYMMKDEFLSSREHEAKHKIGSNTME